MQHRSSVWHRIILGLTVVGMLGYAPGSWAQQRVGLNDVFQELQNISQRLSALEQAMNAASNPLDATVQICANLGGTAGLQSSLDGSAGLGLQGTVGVDVFGNGVTVNPGAQGQVGLNGSVGGSAGLSLTVCFRGVTVPRQTPLTPQEQTFVRGMESTGRQFQNSALALADGLSVVQRDGTSLLIAALESVQRLQLGQDQAALLRGAIEQSGPFQELIATLPLADKLSEAADNLHLRLPQPFDPLNSICGAVKSLPPNIRQAVDNVCGNAKQFQNLNIPATLTNISDSVKDLFKEVTGFTHTSLSAINTAVSQTQGVVSDVNGRVQGVVVQVSSLGNAVVPRLLDLQDAVFGVQTFVTGEFNTLKGGVNTIKGTVNDVQTLAGQSLSSLLSAIDTVRGGLNAVTGVVNTVRSFVGAICSAIDDLPGVECNL